MGLGYGNVHPPGVPHVFKLRTGLADAGRGYVFGAFLPKQAPNLQLSEGLFLPNGCGSEN